MLSVDEEKQPQQLTTEWLKEPHRLVGSHEQRRPGVMPRQRCVTFAEIERYGGTEACTLRHAEKRGGHLAQITVRGKDIQEMCIGGKRRRLRSPWEETAFPRSASREYQTASGGSSPSGVKRSTDEAERSAFVESTAEHRGEKRSYPEGGSNQDQSRTLEENPSEPSEMNIHKQHGTTARSSGTCAGTTRCKSWHAYRKRNSHCW